MLTRASVVTGPEDGLFALLLGAAREAAGAEHAPIGVLEIAPATDPDQPPGNLSIEAALAHEGGLRLRRIDVRVGVELDQPAASELVTEALARFGGTKFTNLCVERPHANAAAAPHELIDVTVTFPSRFELYARNYALLADELDPDERATVGILLTELGVGHRERTALAVRAHQLRAAMRTEQQLSAFLAASRREVAVELYCSPLPPSQSLRLVQRPLSGSEDSPRYRFECVISRGMARAELPIESVAKELQEFVTRRFGVDFAGRSWTVENVHGDRPALRLGVLGDRRGIRWSVNWGHRRD